ncbi:MAG: MFS transporter [Acidimicrobiia bacterium]|nr:MFS transporter [Acidimicrobiia bacterium]MDH4309214.1 MFS transporter [Acidimicrobiia bacterium]MDH5293693.1 MFS transporter [Acidimicrobiia bacterium]
MPEKSAIETNWPALLVVALAYLSVTIGESILSPLFPVVSDRLSIPLGLAGVAFGVLTGATALGNLMGGRVAARTGTKGAAGLGIALCGAGAVLAAAASSGQILIGSQALIGLGSGVFFPNGLAAVRVLSAPSRRGLILGLYGIAFSVGLAIASGVVALLAADRWRGSFLVCAAIAALALIALPRLHLPEVAVPPPEVSTPRPAFGSATLVAAVAAIAQFGVVALLPTFAVQVWGWTEVAAASLLFVGRVVSIPAKAAAGAAVDRFGAITTAKILASGLILSGLGWILTTNSSLGAGLAVAFATLVGGVFPVANAIAVEEFGQNVGMLGTYRATQMGVAAVAVGFMGSGVSTVGFRPVLAAGVLTALAVFLLNTRRMASTS